jgi:hypothetical protein
LAGKKTRPPFLIDKTAATAVGRWFLASEFLKNMSFAITSEQISSLFP